MMKILYVYYSTSGLAGAYIHRLAQTFSSLDCRVYMVVNAYYRFLSDYSNITFLKWFFPVTEQTPHNPRLNVKPVSYFRKPLRYIEQLLAYIKIFLFVIVRDMDVVNLSLNDDRLITLLFVIGLKLLPVELVITAHDVMPFGAKRLPVLRRIMFRLADRLLVHGEHVREQLVRSAGIERRRIHWHVFPLSDYSSIIVPHRYVIEYGKVQRITEKFRLIYLFVGMIRYEKGLDILIEQWLENMSAFSDCLLLIAGYPTIDLSRLRIMSAGCENIRWRLGRLGDEEMVAFMDASDVIVVPYREYAHSTIHLSSYIHSQRCVIASNIALFKDVINESNGFMFSLDKSDSLGLLLRQLRDLDIDEFKRRGASGHRQFCALQDELPEQLVAFYGVRPIVRKANSQSVVV